jgi:hypothetical protein
VPAVVAVKAKEAVRQDAATNKATERLLDEERSVLVSGSRSGKECLELLADGLVEDRALGRSRGVRAISGRFCIDPGCPVGCVACSARVRGVRVAMMRADHRADEGVRFPCRPLARARAAIGGSEYGCSREAGDHPTASARTADLLMPRMSRSEGCGCVVFVQPRTDQEHRSRDTGVRWT